VPSAPSPSVTSRREPPSLLVAALPPDLVRDLRDAAMAARPRRIEELAERVAEHSEAAAATLRDLLRAFRYDLILKALDAQTKAESPRAQADDGPSTD